MPQPSATWRVSLFGFALALSESSVRRLLRLGVLTGVELARHESASGWQPLFETALYRDEVPHIGEPALAAHRNRLKRWVVPALMITGWIAFVGVLMVAEAPPAEELAAIVLLLAGMPAAALAVWTAWFGQSLRTVFGARPTSDSAAPVRATPLLAPSLPQGGDLDALRAELEVLRACRLDADDQAELDRAEAALEALRRP